MTSRGMASGVAAVMLRRARRGMKVFIVNGVLAGL
jgi:hypothetical protein